MRILALMLAAAAFLVSAGLCGIMRRLAPALNLIDRPGQHKQHGRDVPLGGGLAMLATIALAVLAGALVIYGLANWRPDWLPVALVNDPRVLEGLRLKMPVAWTVLAGALALCILGLIDDYRPLGPWIKLVVEFAVVSSVVLLLERSEQIRAITFLPAPLPVVLGIVWIVLITNSINFLDNMDGLSASVVIVCGSIFTAAGMVNGQYFVPALMLVVVGAAAGFLVHNLPPARLFMGDSGSLVLGYFVGLLSVLTTYTTDLADQPAAVLMPLVILALPLYDTISVCSVRLAQGRSPLKGDHSHFSHRLKARGMSGRVVLATIVLATFATGLAGIFLMRLPLELAWIVFVQTLCVVGIIALMELHWSWK